jgi:hypothetical protein
MPTRYAVVIEPVDRHPWTDYMAETASEAQERKQFIEENIRGLKVTIEKEEWGEDRK